MFAEHPCKHPVIVLKDFTGREIAALVDFMYRGEVRVGHEEVAGLIRAAESLQVRGLASSEPRPASPPETPTTDLLLGEPSTPEGAQGTPEEDDNVSESPAPTRDLYHHRDHHRDHRENRLPHMGHLSFSLRELRDSCGSPLMPRRKQARPRRRSGELQPQDLSRPHPNPTPSPPPSGGLNLTNQRQSSSPQQVNQPEDIAENLSMKRSTSPAPGEHVVKTESETASSPRGSPLTGTSLHPDGSLQDFPGGGGGIPGMSALSLTPPHHHSEYLTSLGQLAAQWLPSHPQNQLSHHPREGSPHSRPHPYQQQDSPLTPRRSVAVFPMDGVGPLGGAGGLFPPGSGLDRGSLLADLHDSFKPETLQGLFGGASLGHHPVKKSKKHRGDGEGPRRWSDHGRLPVGRPKGQHSAPRGGPPRSWTNAELTEALQHVWNKKMTTSQASRIFGIPYNSLLMYVRGKYGKSLKLEQLRRDCTGATTGEVMNSLNNNVKAAQPPSQMPHSITGMPHPGDEATFSHPFGGNLPQGFFPDFGAAFPVPVSMVHLLPPSEQKAYEPPSSGGGNNDNNPRSRSPSPAAHDSLVQSTQPATALLQQNGSD